MRRNRKRWLIALGILAGLVVLLVLIWDWNWFKGPIERSATQATGRALTIGDLNVRLSWPPRLRLRNVRFDNATWAHEAEMLDISEAEFTIELGPLFDRILLFSDVRLSDATVALERASDSRDNWTLSRSGKPGTGMSPVVRRLRVDRGLLKFHDPTQNTALQLKVQTTSDTQSEAGVRLHASGRFKAQPLEAEAVGGDLLSLTEKTGTYPINGRFRIGPTNGAVKGKLTNLAELSELELWLEVNGHSLDELFPLIGITLPATPPYGIKGRLKHAGDIWSFHGFEGRVGDSDLSGDLQVRTPEEGRTRIDGRLVSQRLDLDDLGGFIGAPPQTGAGETAAPEQRQESAEMEAKPTLLPDKPFRLERLRAMDAKVHLTGKSIRSQKWLPIDDLELQLELDNGALRAKPLNFGVAGGNIISDMTLDARSQTPKLSSDVQFKHLRLNELFPQSQLMKKSEGIIGGRSVLTAHGNSFADLLDHSDGTLGLATRGGEVSNLVLELLGLDGREVIQRLFGGDKNVQLRCGVADFQVHNGVLETRSFVVDTSDTKINAEGHIDLGKESMDLAVRPLPKDISIASLRSPIHISGTFKEPKIRPDKSLALRGGLAVVLGVIATPAAALLPLIETGPGENADCDALLREMEAHAKTHVPQKEQP